MPMKLEQTHIDQIRVAFQKMHSKEDLLDLLNHVKPLVYGERAIPFELKQLTWYANPELGKSRYSEFKIKKKSGGERTIKAPVNGLKSIQRVLSFILQSVFEPHKSAMGFVREKSIVDNAKHHIGSNYVYNIDLKDFFSTFDQARVWKCLQLKPFNLNDIRATALELHHKSTNVIVVKFDNGLEALASVSKAFEKNENNYISKFLKDDNTISETWDIRKIGLANWIVKLGDKGEFDVGPKVKVSNRKAIANIIAALCCTEMEVERKIDTGEWVIVKRNVLPQGAPTSPVITNIVCQRLDYLLSGAAKRFKLKYSRYADDITFSSMHNVYQPESDFLKELHRIISEQGFYIKESKTRLQKEGYRKEVTGLVVNERVNVQQKYIKQLRMWLYYWERYGYNRASKYFMLQYISDKTYVKNGKSDMANVIAGKLEYLKMVRGADNKLHLKLKSKFDSLIFSAIKPTISIKKPIIAETYSDQVRIYLEVFPSSGLNEKLYNSINIPKDTILPSTFILPNSTEEQTVEEDHKSKELFPHNPKFTTSFLKKFKIGDGSGFKELVHDVILSDETIDLILEKVKTHPNFIYHFKKEWIADLSFLNRAIQKEVIRLIELFEQEGVPFYQRSHKHPFNNDSKYTDYAKLFKKKYRYGSGSEYSKLQSDMIEIFNDHKVPLNSVSFLPDERKFNIRSAFFTWQPSVYKGIRYIIQGIHDHSNIDGNNTFDKLEKKISVEVETVKENDQNHVELRILDIRSVAKIESETLLYYLKGSSPYKFDFRNLCDWIIECDFLDESSKRINLLTAPEYSESIQEIEELPFTVGGFKHIIKFYDVR